MCSITVRRQKGAICVEELATSPKIVAQETNKGRPSPYELGTPLKTVSPLCNHVYDVNNLYNHNVNSLVVAAIRTQGSIITGVVKNKVVEIMVDSGPSMSQT